MASNSSAAVNSGQVVSLLNKLASHLMFPNASGGGADGGLSHTQQLRVQRKVAYSLHLFDSELGRSVDRNRFALVQEIAKHLQRRNGPNGTSDALRFNELAVLLSSHSQSGSISGAGAGASVSAAYLRDDFPILYALYKLADRNAFRLPLAVSNANGNTTTLNSASHLFTGSGSGAGLPVLPATNSTTAASSTTGGGLKLKPKSAGGKSTKALPPSLEPFNLYNLVAGPGFGSVAPSPFISAAANANSASGFESKISGRARDTSGVAELSEERLVRDILYTFQGIDGQYVKWDAKLDGYVCTAPVSDATQLLIRRICELGWMYRRVCAYVVSCLDVGAAASTNANAARPVVGLVEQSFCGALQHELTDYYRLIAVLEAQVTQYLATTSTVTAAAATTQSSTGGRPASAAGASTSGATGGSAVVVTRQPTAASTHENQFTLRRLFVYIQDPLERLRLMAMLADAAKGLKGGALVSAISSYLKHGDPFVVAFVTKVTKQICKPLYEMIRQWVFAGELQDPFSEFFIAANAEIPKDRLWREKYKVRKSMLPSFIDQTLANKILVIGKSINFIRHVCQDSKWSPSDVMLPKAGGLQFSDESGSASGGGLNGLIDSVSQSTNQRLLQLLLSTHRFAEHCSAIKKYLLLGQGDFIQHLLGLLHMELNKPAKEIYAHNLMDTLTLAEGASNAQYEDVEFLKRVSIRYLKPEDGDSGWDVFSLDYKISDSPLSVVLTDASITKYLRVFHFLWRLKRVEHSLARAWQQNMSHLFQNKALQPFQTLLRTGHALRHAMWHFVQNLGSYMMFEVLEVSFQTLTDSLSTSVTCLDDLIRAHDSYLSMIVDRALMDRPAPASASAASSAAGSTRRLSLSQLLTKIFHVILQFGYLQDRIYELSVAEAEKSQSESSRISKRTAAGKWGTTATDRVLADEKQPATAAGIGFSASGADGLAKCTNRLREIDESYHELLFAFFDALHEPPATVASAAAAATATASAAANDSKTPSTAGGKPASASVVDVAPLAFRLDFNGFYAAHRERQRAFMASQQQPVTITTSTTTSGGSSTSSISIATTSAR